MKKRSAITLAGGLVGALVSGLIGYSLRVGAEASSTATPATLRQSQPGPIVKTITTTITIHRKVKPKAPAGVRIVPATVVAAHPATQPVTHTGASATGGDDSGEGGSGGDD